MKRVNPWLWLQERLSAHYVPDDLREQAPSLAPELPYETVVGGYDRPVVLMSDGRIGVVWRLQLDTYEREVEARSIGELVANKLRDLDDIAYVRFASEYYQFRNVGEILAQLEELNSRVRDVKDQQPLFEAP